MGYSYNDIPSVVEIMHGCHMGPARIDDPTTRHTLRKYWDSDVISKSHLARYYSVTRETIHNWGRQLGLAKTRKPDYTQTA